jgi:hypothetical protein
MASTRAQTFLCSLLVAVPVGVAAQAGCGGNENSTFIRPLFETPRDSGNNIPPIGDPDSGGGDAEPADASVDLQVTPPAASVTVRIEDGRVVANPTATFSATANGVAIAPRWLFDRGDLGDVDPMTGIFTATTRGAGTGKVIAQAFGRQAAADVTVKLSVAQNGGETSGGGGGGGAGGVGGVGGEPLGGAVDAATVTKLRGAATADPSARWLYPYNKTVWPRGILAPLLQWDTTKNATAVYVKLSQATVEFEGFYSLAGRTGVQTKRVRVDQEMWRRALNGNDGSSFLKVEVKYLGDDGVVYGPLQEEWIVAPASLAGTVYYNSYDSRLTGAAVGPNVELGGVLSVKVSSKDPARAAAPTLAIPARAGRCHVCHTLSSDGSTMFVQDGEVASGNSQDYRRSLAFDMRRDSDPTRGEKAFTGGGQEHIFTWSAPYPDGSFALASSRFTREARRTTPSALFASSDGAPVASTGLPADLDAVMPAFSPDGRRVVFNFWRGTVPGGSGITTGGSSLALYDFTCGAAAGSVTCSAGAKTFSNPRVFYTKAGGFPGWPSFAPDSKGVAFHNTLLGGDCPDAPRGSMPNPDSNNNCQLTTWYRAESEIWYGEEGVAPTRLDALNGRIAGVSYLPDGPDHPGDLDTRLNYMPTVNPVAAGGYFWAVFTSRRRYGNVLTDHPFNTANHNFGSKQKKLWVAAIDARTGAVDRSHPAFYLPGQELASGNSRGFWVTDPCRPSGTSCETGDECCNGFCRQDPEAGGLVCTVKPPNSCAAELEACKVDADCCDPALACINGRCARKAPPTPR